MTTALDAEQRSAALDPTRSFIVEAPAGSGKTELLIQRLLLLLSKVERPEQIVAITFTRKAAAEMRKRCISTLQAAASQRTAVEAHRETSLELARVVLSHAKHQGWSLIDQPHRLRIMTIDALNATLARQLPILSNGTVSLGVFDESSQLYLLAARRASEGLADSGPLGRALRRLLDATDNSLQQLERWLAGTLQGRDRWLREFAGTDSTTLLQRVESNLASLFSEQLGSIRTAIDPGDELRLFDLLQRRHNVPTERTVPFAQAEGSIESTDTAIASNWREAARLLLTASGDWRKKYTRREGFPAEDKSLHKELSELLDDLQATAGLREGLNALLMLPGPAASGTQTEMLEALEVVLPRLLAELRILFEQSGNVDHTEVALAAQQALGSVDSPSDVLLALDRRIEHILVDEFQDTSHLQWRLLEQLTAGWASNDGRSLFLVGDPMQSIYRFRDADLSLFLKARDQGLGGVRLHSVALSENHRSAREIVDWVNATFARVFPSEERRQSGMPGYRSAVSNQTADPGAGVELHLLEDRGQAAEVAKVIEIIEKELQQSPTQSIGILVRSRTHLAGLRTALRDASLPAHTIEIDSLADTQLGQDLMGLTSALVHAGDRLGWLGLLRSPWCGLKWTDLQALTAADGDGTIRERILDPDCLAGLSTDGAARLQWLGQRLQLGFERRAGLRFGRWIRECWLLLDGPATLADFDELEKAENFFAALDALARNADIGDPAAIRSHFSAPLDGGEIPAKSGIEIMTMHRAKGLEFDTVILHGLGRSTRGNQSKLLYLNDFYMRDGDRLGLLAAASGEREPLVEFLKAEEKRHDEAERGRLLYVAATRAKRRLHLVASVDRDKARPKTGSLLATLWQGLANTPEILPAESVADEALPPFVERPLKRLEFATEIPMPPGFRAMPDNGIAGRPEFEWVRPASVQVGTLIHRELQRLAELAARAGKPVAPSIDGARFRRELALLGVEHEDLPAATERVTEALSRVWEDPTGRWILKPWQESWSELRMTIRAQDGLAHIQLDRSFVDDEGQRWIIDYKTGQHLGGRVERFLDSEVQRYRYQLEHYAQAVAAIDSRPIRVGLYFPLMTELRDWKPAIPETLS